ncbi:hypothetical protein M1146_01425 [Patescibacteria group bacterium]|nr:hypothetical protein [Patescibacteria group bacterium]
MFDLIRNEWEKIPQSIRYIIEIGIALIFNVWMLDHWLPNQALPYKYLGQFDLRSMLYNIGQSFVFLAITLILFKQLFNFPKLIFNYKNKYPIKDLGKKFELIWFSGKLMLFDYNEKKYYHVHPWETAEDLQFVSHGIHIDDVFPNSRNTKIKLSNDRNLDTTEFTNGGSINTQK